MPQLHYVPYDTPVEDVMRILKESGTLVIRNFLDQNTVQKVQDEVDDYVRNWNPGPKYNHDIKNVGSKTKQPSNLSLMSKTYRCEVLNHPWMHAICERMFGPTYGDYWFNGGAILHLEPGENTQPIHQDHVFYQISKWRRPTDPDLTINFTMALTEFTVENGGTRVCPGSHLWENGHASPAEEDMVPVLMQPGDALILPGSMWHSAGANRTSEYRRGFATSFHPCHFTPIESHHHLPREMVEEMTPLVQKMLGFRTLNLHNNVKVWKAGEGNLEDATGLKSVAAKLAAALEHHHHHH
uniref:2-oxoglutarate/Fe(II)-dependent dioxygenase SptF n=1 Tax=Aspergillus sp. TaxID=5065 RepID=UPI001FE242E5|nr:Chain A, 2-oxoglutarate/Fe(II)-dependent dioxygenase SptF [Aspergillus sp.]7EYW_B Chain B, 2-oxoglutarate/Fe(II)-dependent dioxygenase SptF [Aspergillus sp.]7EYW_C Chain C, 2-oxoglutarate/Fe(II)-dependent dioxygenase SptF [Aspergillus sp.]7EYW_D Chain D, 2-oxoglutarate/Fe(II)-dependent dioxygenase SptF [Aspergillus sp.]